jgi:hypothetical protein
VGFAVLPISCFPVVRVHYREEIGEEVDQHERG